MVEFVEKNKALNNNCCHYRFDNSIQRRKTVSLCLIVFQFTWIWLQSKNLIVKHFRSSPFFWAFVYIQIFFFCFLVTDVMFQINLKWIRSKNFPAIWLLPFLISFSIIILMIFFVFIMKLFDFYTYYKLHAGSSTKEFIYLEKNRASICWKFGITYLWHMFALTWKIENEMTL